MCFLKVVAHNTTLTIHNNSVYYTYCITLVNSSKGSSVTWIMDVNKLHDDYFFHSGFKSITTICECVFH